MLWLLLLHHLRIRQVLNQGVRFETSMALVAPAIVRKVLTESTRRAKQRKLSGWQVTPNNRYAIGVLAFPNAMLLLMLLMLLLLRLGIKVRRLIEAFTKLPKVAIGLATKLAIGLAALATKLDI